MGKYTRKAKLTGDMMAVMDVSHSSSFGVRTRAKTLALQKLQAMKSATEPPPSPPPEHHPELPYLQLRSRKLEKQLFRRLTCCRQQNPNPTLVNSSGLVGSGSVEIRIRAGEETEETSFGENNLDFDGRERSSSRESSPCSSIKDFNVISTPSSTVRSTPLAREIEEFFAVHEQQQHRRFADRYNFDFVNERPLEGCYEWVKVEF